jgi:Xaa-Pro aminopeptidase
MDQLITLIKNNNLDGYLITTLDEYNSEYAPNNLQRLKYITNFESSNCIALITKFSKHYCYTDSRYILAAKNTLSDKNFVINEQIGNNVKNVGYNPKIFTKASLSKFEHLNLIPIDEDFVDKIWDRDLNYYQEVYDLDIKYTAKTAKEKIEKSVDFIKDEHFAIFINDSNLICYLLNKRGFDVEYNTVFLSYLLIYKNQEFVIYTNNKSIKNAKPLNDIYIDLAKIDHAIYANINSIPIKIFNLIKHKKQIPNEILLMPSIKHKIEIEHIRDAHTKDGIAVTNAIKRVKEIYKSNIKDFTEYDVANIFLEERKKMDTFITESFAPIVGFNSNGAIIHYKPTRDNSSFIIKDYKKQNGIVLVDSGGHYLYGTTDITRVFALYENSITDIPNLDKIKKCYTLVLKGLISLGLVCFKKGTTGSNLDILARMHLYKHNYTYDHGTSHGVGAMLSVHEGIFGINSKNTIPLEENMVMSNEPGVYFENEFGIRLENVQYVESKNDHFLCFKQLTTAPFEEELIDYGYLTKEEVEGLCTL